MLLPFAFLFHDKPLANETRILRIPVLKSALRLSKHRLRDKTMGFHKRSLRNQFVLALNFRKRSALRVRNLRASLPAALFEVALRIVGVRHRERSLLARTK